MKHETIRTPWSTYLYDRPEFMKWRDHTINEALYHLKMYEGDTGEVSDLDEVLHTVISNYRKRFHNALNNSICGLMGLVKMHEDFSDPTRKQTLLDLDDEEALANTIIYIELYEDCSKLVLVNYTRPRMTAKEAEYIESCKTNATQAYLNVLCDRSDGKYAKSDKHRKSLWEMFSYSEMYSFLTNNHEKTHCIWDNMATMVDTYCKYDQVDLLSEAGHDVVIDENYLNKVLLAPKPTIQELGEDDWNLFVRTLINQTVVEYDKACREYRETHSQLEYGACPIIVRSLSPIIRQYGSKGLAFAETIYDFMYSLPIENIRFRPHMLKPRLFDLYREYGMSFVTPLFMRTFDEMEDSWDKSLPTIAQEAGD